MMAKTVIISGVRTPFGKFGGGLSSLTASQLGGIAIKEALVRAGIEGSQVDEVIMGMCFKQAKAKYRPARQPVMLDCLGK